MQEFLTKSTAGLPNWAWGLVVVAGLGIGYFVMRGSQQSSTTPQTDAAGQAVATAPVDANAMTASGVGNGGPQIVVLPLSSTAPGGSTSSDGSTGTPAPTPASSPPGQPRGRNVSTTVLTIRSKGSSVPSVAAYDANNPPGVPVRATPGGVQVRYQAYGSQVNATGTEVTGPNNVKEGSGSTSWWPIQGGYISAFDVTGISQQNTVIQVSG